jgi:tetratricopeptide (TPR) repeat protein
MQPLAELFSRAALRGLADPAVYGRGVGYLQEGRVEPLAREGSRFRATVRGSVPYTVELWDDGGRPGWSCTCPYAEDGAFCKHGVAVALLLDAGAPPDALPADLQGPVDEPRDDADGLLVEHLDGLDRDRLVALVLEAADQDWRLRERLLADARAARGEGPALAAWRRRVDAAFSPYDEFVSYREAAGWAGEVDEVIDALAELCDAGHPEAAAVLAEHAHRRADDAIGYVDDSDGWLMDISQRLAEVHLHACIEGAPDPVELAGRLVALELSSELDGFHRAAATYAGVLGHDGLAAYRRSLAPRWDEVRSQSEGWSSQRFRLREAMIGVAIASGDPDELIAIYRDDLRTPDGYLEIARTLRAAGRDAEAEAWARDGLAAFSGRSWQTPPLREFLAGLLRDRGERSAAVELFWEAFLRAPSLTTYRRLVDEASEDAPAVKTRALEALTSRIERPADGDAPGASGPSGELVEILAFEGETERAWQVATVHGCDRQLLLTLARSREDSHPLDAIGVYEPEVFALIETRKNAGYGQAVDLLGRIQRLARRADQPQRFEDILQRVRAEHGRKRNLMQLIDQKGGSRWPRSPSTDRGVRSGR